MSSELLSVLEYMEKEKGISRQDMIETISAAIRNAATKGVNAGQEMKIEINPKTGALKAWASLIVVDSVSDPAREVHIEKAYKYTDTPKLGDIVYKEMDPALLGRIAAQAARQAIHQRIRQFEKDRIFDEFKDMVGDVVTGIVRRREKGDLIIDLGKAEAVLPARERIATEDYSSGETIRCLLLAIEQTPRGPELVLSRSHVKFVRRLFELEVTEIADKTVNIVGMAREAGYRTKMSVDSTDPKIDPVGACVGSRGARVKNIVRELGGEKIDIIRHFDDPHRMLEEAIKPAVPKNIRIDAVSKRIYFEVAESDLSVAIGKKGQNAKLTSRLMGWKLDIGKEKSGVSETGFEERKKRAVSGWNIPGVTEEQVERLVALGITTPEAFEGVTAADLTESHFTDPEANALIQKINEYLSKKER
jgi:N utilization substance protein A